MKRMILGLVLLASCSAFAMDPASTFVNSTLTRGVQILSLKSETAKARQFCSLVKSAISSNYISSVWLGSFASSPDKAGVTMFRKAVPSILVSKLIPALGNGGGSFTVGPNAVNRGNGTFEVDLTVHNSSGNPYSGKAIVASVGGGFKLIDAHYMGFSAVSYLGNDYQKRFRSDGSRTPITNVTKQIISASDFINCQ